MLFTNQSATIRQLLVLAYLAISAPAIVFVVATAYGFDLRIELAQKTALDGDAFTTATRPDRPWLVEIGRSLRKLNAPFATSPRLKMPSAYNEKTAQELSDVRAGIIYLWLFIFITGASLVWLLSIRLQQPLNKLTEAIERLALDDLVEPVSISGPRNIHKMSLGLEQLRVRINESDMRQSQFLRHISHEIKTPLTSIKEGSQLLEDELLGPVNIEQREVIEILNKSTKELQGSIENLLSYNSALSVDKVKQRQTTDLSQLVQEVLDKQALGIKKKLLNIDLNIRPVNVFVNQNQVLTVFDNLVSNAIKYSPKNGTIQIILNNADDRAVFIVKDNGPGIPVEHRTAIFDAFFVGKQSPQSTLKGTGLGLSIARQYVELHQGRIDVMTTRKGAGFRVVFKS